MFSTTTASSSRCVVTSASTIKTSSKSRDAIRRSSGRVTRCHQRQQRQQQQQQQRRFVATISVSLDNKISNNNNIRRRRRYSSSIVKSSQDDENTATPSSTGFDGFDTGTTVTDEDQERLQLMSQIKDWLKLLYVKREMSFNEVKLIIGIEDPRLADRETVRDRRRVRSVLRRKRFRFWKTWTREECRRISWRARFVLSS